ncbi:hypothetical protein GQ55_2G289600 [Panicum hallii var. hallii]|uniref:Uncharacterized protein n=1 Tax=Panicum hallii var. hallii TaxID=1504633 RepID=A0A2T7ETH0_9POAL|nr:hypothetical protein GQ55_2G289600 [Panicum hallii var. hallii]
MLEQDDGRQEGEEDAAGRGVPRRAAGAGSGGGRDVAGGRAWLLRPRHRRALLRRVPPPLQARRGVLAAGRCPAATSGEGGASIDARAALEHLQMQRIVDFVHIRSQGIIISIIIICVGFASTIAADTTNITSFGFIGFGIITTHRGAQEWRDTEKEAKDNTMKGR